jgi:hypothetical protein
LGSLELSGSLLHRHTSESNFNFDNGRVRFVNSELAELELAGQMLGQSTNGLGNFGFQQLQVGNATTNSTLILGDRFDNGNRNGGVETQYLLDVNGQGLVLQNGSTVVLNGYDLLISNGTDSFFSARDLIGTGERYVQYGDGFISLTGDVGQILNGDFITGDLTGFKTVGSGMAEVIETAGDPPFLQLTAGSPIEISQFVSTMDDPFFISFDAMTGADSGMLSLFLDGQLLNTWDYSELLGSDFARFDYLVNDPSLRGLIDVEIGLLWDADTGDSVQLNNWRMSAVPEPGSLAVLALLGMGVATKRTRRRSLG